MNENKKQSGMIQIEENGRGSFAKSFIGRSTRTGRKRKTEGYRQKETGAAILTSGYSKVCKFSSMHSSKSPAPNGW